MVVGKSAHGAFEKTARVCGICLSLTSIIVFFLIGAIKSPPVFGGVNLLADFQIHFAMEKGVPI
jgi:hypothetical protein